MLYCIHLVGVLVNVANHEETQLYLRKNVVFYDQPLNAFINN